MSNALSSIEWRQAWVADTVYGRLLICRLRGFFDGFIDGEHVTSGMSLAETKERMVEAVRRKTGMPIPPSGRFVSRARS